MELYASNLTPFYRKRGGAPPIGLMRGC